MDMGYYYGIPGNLVLLAKSHEREGLAPTYLEEETGIYRIQGKRIYEVEDTEIGEVEDGEDGPTSPVRECHKGAKGEIRDKIIDVVFDMVGRMCLGVDIKRIGFHRNPTENPVVVLITLGIEATIYDAKWVRDVILELLEL
jgi:hypothetical protein